MRDKFALLPASARVIGDATLPIMVADLGDFDIEKEGWIHKALGTMHDYPMGLFVSPYGRTVLIVGDKVFFTPPEMLLLTLRSMAHEELFSDCTGD